MKLITCNKCGTENLVWRASKAGNFYLSDPAIVGGKRGGRTTVFFVHKCPVEVEVEIRSLEFYTSRVAHLTNIKERFPDSWGQKDENELDVCNYYINKLTAKSNAN